MPFRVMPLAVLLLAISVHARGSEIEGTVVDAQTGQRIQNATVAVDGRILAVTDPNGSFRLSDVDLGSGQVEVSAAEYTKRTLHVGMDSNGTPRMEINLMPVAYRHVDRVSVRGSIEDASQAAFSGHALNLSGEDLRNLSTVLADDPLRAVQALPGVTSNDDFEARFSLRGEDFSRIGVYLDGVLLHDAIHNLEGTDLSGSASVFNANLMEGLNLYEDSRPERASDTSGAALDVQMRDGSRDRYSFQFTANLASAGLSAGGPLERNGRCSWIAGFRKSYLQYILAQTLTDPSMAFGITDGEGRLSCALDPKNTISLDVVDSYTDLDRSAVKQTLGANALMLVGQHATFANLSWMYAPNANAVITNHVAWMDDKFDAQNPASEPLGHGSYGEWAWNSNATWTLSPRDAVNAGGSMRWIHDAGFTTNYDTARYIDLVDQYQASDALTSGYIENTWTAIAGRLRLTTGGRWDHDSTDRVLAFSPQTGAVLKLNGSLQLQAGWGQFVQYPPASVFGSNLGASTLLPMRSTQASVALEESIGWSTRVRVEAYDRQDRDLLYQPWAGPRLVDGTILVPPLNPMYESSLRGRARGVEFSVNRKFTKGVSGWLSYAYGKASMHDGFTGDAFPADLDQRHTVNAYATYRIRPSVNLSARWTYGSGFPAPGYLSVIGPAEDENFYLASERNRVRIGPYQRVDVRVNKTWSHETHSTTLYAEVMNVINKSNYRFGSLDGYRTTDHFAYVTVDQMFPILPSVGVVFAW